MDNNEHGTNLAEVGTDCISRQAAIDAVEAIAVDTRYYWAIKNLPSAPRWIPCSERLPEDENKAYWVCTDTGYQCECRWTNVNPIWTALTTDWHWNIFDIPQYTKVVAWMPLPEPYEGETDE